MVMNERINVLLREDEIYETTVRFLFTGQLQAPWSDTNYILLHAYTPVDCRASSVVDTPFWPIPAKLAFSWP